jgi:hypothetical protein
MGRLARSWELVGKSFGVLLSDKELLFLPIVSAISCLIVSVTIVSGYALAFPRQIAAFAAIGPHRPPITQGMWACLILFYLANYFIVVFFNVALVSAASDRLAGGHATINHGLQVAWARKGKIFQWALLAATFGVLLNLLEERLGWLGRLVVRLIGVAWTMATYFVVPLLAAQDIGPVEALQRSAELFTETWGEELIGGFSFGLIFVLLAAPGTALPVFFGLTFGSTGALMGVILAALYWLLLAVIGAAAQGIFIAALYRYATTKQVSATFRLEDFSTAWQPKH